MFDAPERSFSRTSEDHFLGVASIGQLLLLHLLRTASGRGRLALDRCHRRWKHPPPPCNLSRDLVREAVDKWALLHRKAFKDTRLGLKLLNEISSLYFGVLEAFGGIVIVDECNPWQCTSHSITVTHTPTCRTLGATNVRSS
jgi:hypothetical protein